MPSTDKTPSRPSATTLGLLEGLDAAGRSAFLEALRETKEEVKAEALAPNTRRAYTLTREYFATFCDELGLPATPAEEVPGSGSCVESVTLFLLWLRHRVDPDDPGLKQLKTSSIRRHLAALNDWFDEQGWPKPGADAALKRVMKGLAARRDRRFRARPEKVEPLVVEDLRRVIDNMRTTTLYQARDHVLLLLRREGYNASEMSRLSWEPITFGDSQVSIAGEHPLEVELGSGLGEALGCYREVLGGMPSGPVARQLGRDRTGSGEVAKAMTPNSITARLWSIAKGSGLPVSKRPTMPNLATDVVERLARHILRPSAVLRDEAVLIDGFSIAGRESELAALTRQDLTRVPTPYGDGYDVEIPWSKTDQEGKGATLPLSPTGSAKCPVATMAAWLGRAEELLGRPLEDDWPVFFVLRQDGSPELDDRGRPVAMDGEAISRIVQRRCEDAGLADPDPQPESVKANTKSRKTKKRYRGHSLRRGFATSAKRAGVPDENIRRITRHVRLDNLYEYIDPCEKQVMAVVRKIGL